MESTRLRLLNGEHIFYYTDDPKSYVNNAVQYIVSGVEQGHVLFMIEEDTRYKEIYSRLRGHFTEEQLRNVHYVNSEEFYCMNGDFHTPTIMGHFNQILEPFLEKKLTIRTWGHVGWGEQEGILNKLQTYENCADDCINEVGTLSVCAYEASKVSSELKKALLASHEFYMTDNNTLGPSELFSRIEAN